MTNQHGAGATHGGARPKQREDDARGGARQGTGPKPKSFTLKLGDKLWLGGHDANGNGINPSQLWTITEITRTHVVFSSDNGDTYRLVR